MCTPSKKARSISENNAPSLASAASDSLHPTVMRVLRRSAQNNAGAIEHVLPHGTTPDDVELSIVIPAMNEEITVGEFMEWCKEGLQRAGVSGQILIVDSSTDNTPSIVLEHGGEVLRTPKRGVGRAYLDAIPYIRGKWILMGDADLTYDFREIAPFEAALKRTRCQNCIVTLARL